jgi:hypothetical protein
MGKISNYILRTMFNQMDREYALSGFWYSVFRPIGNRYYVGMKLYTISFIIQYLPLTLLFGYILIDSNAKVISLIFLIAWLAVAAFDFFVIRGYEQKVTWKYLYSARYADGTDNEDQRIASMMSKIEKDPTPENETELQDELKKDNKT